MCGKIFSQTRGILTLMRETLDDGMDKVSKGHNMMVARVIKLTAVGGNHTALLICAHRSMADETRRAVVFYTDDRLLVDLVEEAFAL